MKGLTTGGIVILQLLSLMTFSFDFNFGSIFCGIICLGSLILGIIFVFNKNIVGEKKQIGYSLIFGTLITIFLVGAFFFWLINNFSR